MFTGPGTIENIVSWVTGGNVSLIDGHLRSEIDGASLFLLNPNGVILGPHAVLDVSGALHISTADYLLLADGQRFVAPLTENRSLSVAAPAVFGFLGRQSPAQIIFQGSRLRKCACPARIETYDDDQHQRFLAHMASFPI